MPFRQFIRSNARYALLLLITVFTTACASLMSQGLADSLSLAIVNQDDPETVRAGAPAYLLLIDGMIDGNPGDLNLLIAAAKLNTAYAAVFISDKQRARRMGQKAHDYAQRALCQVDEDVCGLAQRPYEELQKLLTRFDEDEVEVLLSSAMAWALWIQQRSDNWEAMADLPKVEAMLERVVALNEAYQHGQAHLYLGVLRSLRPPALGGNPEQGRYHFERAIELSLGRDLSVKVAYARYYTRLLFNQKLHDQLLTEVLESDPRVHGLTLGNVLAQQEAQQLLAGSADYFLE